MAAAPARRVLLLALASRLSVLAAMLLADRCFPDLDSSARLQGFPCASAAAAGGDCGAGAADSCRMGGAPVSKPPLAVWDTVYFLRVAQCGYETDKINAFFPALPAAMRALGAAVAVLLKLLGAAQPSPDAAHAVAGLALNVVAFCLAALCLHRLGLRVLAGRGDEGIGRGGEGAAEPGRRRSARLSGINGSGGSGGNRSSDGGRDGAGQGLVQAQHVRNGAQQAQHGRGAAQQAQHVADLALLLFCFNPASVFYSAAYSESLFAAATWAGLLLLPSHHWAGVAALTLASAARSNGILGVWFPLHEAMKLAAGRRGRLTLAKAARTAASCAVILAPYAAMQAQAYFAHCTTTGTSPGDVTPTAGALAAPSAGSLPPWCASRLPSVYSYIQKQYWDVGLLRFYRDPSRLPMVLMSVPVALLSIGGAWTFFSADWQRALTLGLYCRQDRLPHWLAAPARTLHSLRRWCRPDSGGSKQRQQRGRPHSVLQASPQAASLVYHWALMTAVALLAMHVNVATRFLSACPPLYWHAAEALACGDTRARLVWLWCFAYIALGCMLFPNFYPWA